MARGLHGRPPQGPQLIDRLAKFPYVAAALAALCLLLWMISGLGYRAEWWHYRTGFTLMRWAAYGGIAVILIALVGVVVTRPGTGRSGFWIGWIALVAGAFAAGYPFAQLQTVYSVPFIHDITTDTLHPPEFVDVLPLRGAEDNPAAYDGEEVAKLQLEGYPDLGPLRLGESPEQIFPIALAAAEAMGWEIVAAEESEGRIEATDTTFWYGFKDDVVIRMAPHENGSIVDIRSKSRVGRSDLGVNAQRIRAYLAELKSRL